MKAVRKIVRKPGIVATAMALTSLAIFEPAFAAGATRSAALIPLAAQSVGSVPYTPGIEGQWTCVEVTDAALKLNDDEVQVDPLGKVVLDPAGNPYRCTVPAGGASPFDGGFPIEILLGLVGLGGLLAAVGGGGGGGSGGPDTPG